MFKKFKTSELLLFAFAIFIIFVSEYYYIVLDKPLKAIFVGLWPPTIIGVLIYMELKKRS